MPPIGHPGNAISKADSRSSLADYASELQTMLRICNSDKTEIRNWQSDSEDSE